MFQILYSAAANEIWSIGDCGALVNGLEYRQESQIEKIAVQVRSIVLHAAISNDFDEGQLLANDPGRVAILPLIRASRRLRNSDILPEYRFDALDGFSPTPPRPTVYAVPVGTQEIVLAFDGYPVLRPTLAESELELSKILEQDPLCYRAFQATKGRYSGQVSFDDRCYLRLSLSDNSST